MTERGARLRPLAGRARRAMIRLSMRLKPSLASTPAQRFFRDGHNDLLTRGLNLTADSVVLDFGGYLGDWTAEIRKIYDSTVHVFEPIPDFADAIRLRFDGDGKVIVHQVAIGAEQGTMTIFLADDATGVGVQGDPVVVDVVGPGYLDAVGVGRCDVVAINIEGGNTNSSQRSGSLDSLPGASGSSSSSIELMRNRRSSASDAMLSLLRRTSVNGTTRSCGNLGAVWGPGRDVRRANALIWFSDVLPVGPRG